MNNKIENSKKVSLVSLIGNIFLLSIKSLVAFTSNSQSLIADTFNSAGDILSSFMTYVGSKISSKNPDEDHNLGHGKAEYIYSLLVSIIMLLFCINVIKDSIFSIIYNEKLNYSFKLIVICIITILVKFVLFLYSRLLYKKDKSILIKTSYIDHRNDMLITLTTLISIILSHNNIMYIDSIVGILISLWIMYVAVKLFIESYNVLMDKSLNDETKEKVISIVHKYNDIKGIRHFNSTPVGYKYQISFTIFVDGNMSTFKSHEIANKLEKDIIANVPEIYLAVIHVNPIKEERRWN